MRSLFVMVVVSLALFETGSFRLSMAGQNGANARDEGALGEARRLADELSDKIRGLLFKELQRGGPVTALRICSEVAQEITGEFNRHAGQQARRVSVRYRNPGNLPDEYERKLLARMEADNRQKSLAKEYAEVVIEHGEKVLRYMRPLIAGPVCLNCHGPKETMAPEMKRILAERYPEDLATGFHEGDLRGAISIKLLLKR